MTTQIDNLVVSFNEILLHTGNLFDELITDRTANIVLPNNNRTSEKLNSSIKAFDSNLDSILLQLSDLSLLDAKLKQRVIERELQKEAEVKAQAEAAQQDKLKQQHQQLELQKQQDEQLLSTATQPQNNNNNYTNDLPNEDFSNSDNILNDITDFLSTVPDAPDMNVNPDFNENIQDLLMEAGNYGDNGDGLNIDFSLYPNQDGNSGFNDYPSNNNNNNNFSNGNNNDNNFRGGNNNVNSNNLGNVELNLDIDNDIFNEIDSMLNL